MADAPGFAQAEGVADLSGVPGVPREHRLPGFKGGLAATSFTVAICPPDTRRGVRISDVEEAPLPKFDSPLHSESARGVRVR